MLFVLCGLSGIFIARRKAWSRFLPSLESVIMKRAQSYSPIKKQPYLAQKIGKIIAEYALLEYFLAILYCALSRSTPEEAIKTFYSQRSLRNQKRIINEAASYYPNKVMLTAIKRILRRMSKAANKRTEVAHCLFTGNSKQMLRLVITQDGPQFSPFTHDDYVEVMGQYRTLLDDISTFLGVAGLDAPTFHRISRAIDHLRFPGTLEESTDAPPRLKKTKESDTADSLRRLGLPLGESGD